MYALIHTYLCVHNHMHTYLFIAALSRQPRRRQHPHDRRAAHDRLHDGVQVDIRPISLLRVWISEVLTQANS